MNKFKRLFYYLNIKNDLEDFQVVHDEIERNVVFKGTNLWILVFAIVIASVGLNTNSTAVIIGAMLISPLMGPINGMGYSLATYNFPLFRRALKNFLFAVGAGLTASTIYFAISPVSSAHSELLARTSPTIYDVLIALFGGLAGIVAISSKLKGNVIPGVAIATALMPPLCTAGYGLATGQLNFFLGAFYLFTINTVFIALSSVIVSQFFDFPITTLIEEQDKKRVNRWISIITIVTLLPSIYFGYQLVLREKFHENVARFVKNVTVYEGSYLLQHESDPAKRSIRLIYAGKELSDNSRRQIRQNAEEYNLQNATIKIEQGFSLQAASGEQEALKRKIEATLYQLEDSRKQIDSLVSKPLLGRDLLAELRPLYPDIASCLYADTYEFTAQQEEAVTIAVVVLSFQKQVPPGADQAKIREWLKVRLHQPEELRIYFQKFETPAEPK